MALNDSFSNLVNDITKQVLEQVQQQVQTAISSTVSQRVNELITGDTIKSAVNAKINDQIDSFQLDLTDFDNRIIEAGNRIINQINTSSMNKVDDLISSRINGIDLEALVKQYIESNLNSDGRHLSLLPGAIPGSAVDVETLAITGDNIRGGTVKLFASTGIEDMATECRLTILDIGTIFENTLYAPQIEIKGNAVIDGDLLIKGVIPKETQTYQNLVADVGSIAEATYDRVFATLQTQSLDIAKLTIGQRSIIEGDTLTTAVANSNLRRVGVLQDLQTSGETLLSETLYSSNKRVGINTMDPNMALSIWDEEVDVSIGKRSQGVAQVTTRAGTMVLGINNQNNITLTADGNVAVEQIKIGRMQFGTSGTPPTVDLAKGTVIFNENPSLGGPLGWVSLGDARWANFGIID